MGALGLLALYADLVDAPGADMSDTVQTFVDRVRDYFLARPGQWVSAIELERIGGRQAWRTRVSDCRRQYAMAIEWRGRRIVEDGKRWTLSEYRYVPRTWREEATNSPDGLSAVVDARLF